ncbi:MAG TPA: VOC family protein [Terracidiphilus sp.]|nr:VOC family protein [Terracidiphilus sp.]
MKTRWMAVLAAVGVLGCGSCSYAQNTNGGIDGIAHIAYRVSNLDNELAFLKKLGYEEAFRMTRAGRTSEVFVKVNDRQFIEVYPRLDSNQPLGWMHVCYESADLNALHDSLVGQGLSPTRVQKASAGNLIMSLKDPDGRVVEFTQYMPGSLHTQDQGKHLGANRVSDTLLGFDLPVGSLRAAKEFYTRLGFGVEGTDRSLRMTVPDNAKLAIEVRAEEPGALAETLFAVYDAHNAEQEMDGAGLNAKRIKKLVIVRDPDGNPLVFLQSQ